MAHTDVFFRTLVLAVLFLPLCACNANKKLISIGTGAVTGVYYPTGGAISRLVNQSGSFGVKASVESTAGSVYNINAVLKGDLDFGIAQSDRQFQAFFGQMEWQDAGPQTRLRSVFSIHSEAVTLIAAADSGIVGIKDLKNKRVNIGNPGSGHRQNALDVLAAFDMGDGDIHFEEVRAVEAPGLLQDGRIDAFFYTVGHPNASIKEATAGRRKVRLIPIRGQALYNLIQSYPYYARTEIPADYYSGAVNPHDIVTVGVKATLVTTREMPKEVVYALTKVVFENFDYFKSLHEAFANLKKEDMFTGLSAPLHVGALRYFRDAGLLDYVDPRLFPPEWTE